MLATSNMILKPIVTDILMERTLKRTILSLKSIGYSERKPIPTPNTQAICIEISLFLYFRDLKTRRSRDDFILNTLQLNAE